MHGRQLYMLTYSDHAWASEQYTYDQAFTRASRMPAQADNEARRRQAHVFGETLYGIVPAHQLYSKPYLPLRSVLYNQPSYTADYTLSACLSPCRSTVIRFIPNNYGIWHRYGQDCPPEPLQN